MGKERLSRQEFLKVGVLFLAGFLTSCRRNGATLDPTAEPTATRLAPSDTPSPSPEPTIAPTTTPEATAEVLSGVEAIPFNPEQQIPVLEQHNPNFGVSGSDHGEYYMTPQVYEEQLRIIQEMGFYTPSEEDLLGWLEGKHGLPARSVIVRIDLGMPYFDYEDGFCLLKQYGLKSILFIRPTSIPETASATQLGWDIIKGYFEDGTLIPGSHGMAHPHYPQISESDAVRDAVTAQEEISQILGRPVNFFAFPYDEAAHEDALLSHFRMLFGAYGRTARAGEPLIGTYYPYVRGEGYFNWDSFRQDLLRNIEEEAR